MHDSGNTSVEYRRKPNFFERVGKSCSGILLGLCMFIFSFIILHYNEGLSVSTMAALNEGAKEVVSLDASAKFAFDRKLVHHVGTLQTNQELIDPTFDLHVRCVKLHRKVEMYQWVEHTDVKEFDEGDRVRKETTYSYSTEWRTDVVHSRNFDEEVGHHNPTEMFVKDIIFTTDTALVDGVQLSSSLVNQIHWYQVIHSLPPPKQGLNSFVHLHYYYHGKNPDYPQVGDTRIHFQCAGVAQGSTIGGSPDKISIIAMLSGNTFIPYKTQNENYIEFLYRGSKSVEEIFDAEYSSNSTRTWLLRIFGFILMFIGLSIMSSIIVTLVDWIPIVREIVSFSVTMFNLSMAVFLTLATIAFSWLWHRPLFASALLAAACLPWYLSRQRARSYLSR